MKWLKSKSRREITGFVATGIAAVVAAAWAVFTFFYRPEEKRVIEATYHICHASDGRRRECKPGSTFIDCGESFQSWVNRECAKYDVVGRRTSGGGMCGLEEIDIKCTASSGR
jgi:hypothetical protein